MQFAWIEPGEFVMGSPYDEPYDIRPAPPHEVRITRGFYLGRHEVTQGQWQRVMGENPSHFAKCGSDCPVENVSWNEVQRFIDRIRELSGQPGLRLPTEAEWEYACRAGTQTPFWNGASLTVGNANFDGRMPYPGQAVAEFRGAPLKVGSFAPSPWGLFDMHGNVWEWTSDDYCPYAEENVKDPVGECASGLKNIRGGSWYFSAASARCGRRYTHDPGDRGFSIGFRLVRDVD
jgi:formylglycine-generating enzyme required for sulfatase activity